MPCFLVLALGNLGNVGSSFQVVPSPEQEIGLVPVLSQAWDALNADEQAGVAKVAKAFCSSTAAITLTTLMSGSDGCVDALQDSL